MTIELDCQTVMFPIMSTMLVAFTQPHDVVNLLKERVHGVLRTRHPNGKPATEAAPLIVANL